MAVNRPNHRLHSFRNRHRSRSATVPAAVARRAGVLRRSGLVTDRRPAADARSSPRVGHVRPSVASVACRPVPLGPPPSRVPRSPRLGSAAHVRRTSRTRCQRRQRRAHRQSRRAFSRGVPRCRRLRRRTGPIARASPMPRHTAAARRGFAPRRARRDSRSRDRQAGRRPHRRHATRHPPRETAVRRSRRCRCRWR